MSAKSKKKRPAARKPARPVKAPLWSDADVSLLRREVAKGPSANQAFGRVAKATGRSAGTVQAKWYSLQKKSRKVRAGSGSVSVARKVSQPRVAAAPSGSFELEMGKLLGMLEASDVPEAIKLQAERVWRLRS